MDSEVWDRAEEAEERRLADDPWKDLAAAVIKEAYDCLRRALIRKKFNTLDPKEEQPESLEKFLKDMSSPYHKTLDLPIESYKMMIKNAHTEAREYVGRPPNQRRSWQTPLQQYRKRSNRWKKKSGK
jgi:hypothetical protein